MPFDASSFGWSGDDTSPLGLDFCLTFAQHIGVAETIARLDGGPPIRIVGAEALEDAADLVRKTSDATDGNSYHADRSSGLYFIASIGFETWTMVQEPSGLACKHINAIAKLSRDGHQATFFYNENTAPQFIWADHGDVLLEFDPSEPGRRRGSRPDLLDDILIELGFDIGHDGSYYDPLLRQRSLALMQHLTGVHLSPNQLEDATYYCAAIPDPSVAKSSLDPHTVEDTRRTLADYAREISTAG
jgi:hypothetical protein